ncbi:three-helix bundle dimerization domain-containing protein [Streptomyces sp. NPDC059092]|uniref:three-helix bundle dimerization domain-containing protein n=1 Tax=Streptomyces sp. NPDC059092 TaxID=3346725 RepID=UPI0036BB8CE3
MNTPGAPEPGAPADSGPGPHSPAEQAALRRVTERLKASFPAVDSDTVDALVRTAHEALRHAKVRAYVPVLVERRARIALAVIAAETRSSRSSGSPQRAETDPA